MKKFVKFEFSIYGRSQGLQWVQMHPHGGENKLGVIYRVVSAPPGRAGVNFRTFLLGGRDLKVGVVHLVVLDRFWRATTKEGRHLF